MQTGEAGDIPATNFSVASLQRRVFARSNVGIFFVNKQLTSDPEARPDGLADFNRVIGIDYNLASADSRWTGKFFVHKALTPEQKDESSALSANLVYNTQQWRVEGNYDLVGENYQAEAGFVRRTGLHRAEAGLSYRFYPPSKRIANHGPSLSTFHIFDPDFEKTDAGWEASYQFSFLDRSGLRVSYEQLYIRLLDPFDPTNSVGNILETGTEYNWGTALLNYASNARKLFNYEATLGYGGFYNGTRLFLESQVNFRFQPYGSISVNLAYNDLQFPAPFQDANFFLVGPKLDLTLSTSVFFTAFIQYNEQIDNINTNIRFQWRYQPVSDLFIVYSDNYFPSPFNVRNRALVAKVSYWFN
jgi:hypothetical protein